MFDYYPLKISRLIRETADACSVVFDIPHAFRELFSYRSGQYLTLRINVEGEVLERCYSLSSSPAVENEIKVTVKAVEHGRMSNWINNTLREGDVIEVMPPAGRFCLRDNELREHQADLLLFSAGSGITPCISILKTALAQSARKVRMLYANRDEQSIIFRDELIALRSQYPVRFELIHSLDVVNGFVNAELVTSVAAGMANAECFICGPGPFMDVVESTLLGAGFARQSVLVERFTVDQSDVAETAQAIQSNEAVAEVVTIVMDGKSRQLTYKVGDTLLEAARRDGIRLPFSCRLGNCATCIAKVTEGSVRMKQNNVLTEEEVAEGYVLVCQSIPTAKRVTVEYDD